MGIRESLRQPSVAEFVFSTVIFLVFLALMINFIAGERLYMSDFKVLYLAGQARLNCEEVYFQVFGIDTGLYKYSPFFLLLLIPFSLLPYAIASPLYFILNTLLLCVAIIYARKLWNRYFNYSSGKVFALLLLTSLVAFSHLLRDVQLGNTNIFLLLLSIAAFRLISGNRELTGGLLLAFIVLIKPHFVIVLPLLLLRRKYRTLTGLASGLLLGFLLPGFFTGFAENISQHQAWIETMIYHNVTQLSSQNTIQHLLFQSTGNIFPGVSVTLQQFGVIAIVALAFLLFLLKNFKLEKDGPPELSTLNFTFEFFLLISLIPSLTITDTEHFLFSIPLIMLIMAYLFQSRNRYFIIVSVIAFIFYIGTWGDLLGSYSRRLEQLGSVGIGNLMIIVISFIIMLIARRKFLHFPAHSGINI
jgi:hypothetical protein